MPYPIIAEDEDMTDKRAIAGLAALSFVLADRKEKGAEVASVVELAQILGISKQALSQWVRIPAEHVVTIERLTGLPRHIQRPDVFPHPGKEQAVFLLPEREIDDIQKRVSAKIRARRRARARERARASKLRRSPKKSPARRRRAT